MISAKKLLTLRCLRQFIFALFVSKCNWFLAGSAYEEAILPLQILMPAIVFIAISNLTGIQMLVPLGREKVVLYSEIAGMLTDLVLNALLIPKIGAAGAAIGTMVAEAVVLGVQCMNLGDEILHYLTDITWWKILTGCAAGAAGSVWVYYVPLGDFLAIVFGGCTFFGIYLLLMLILRENMTMVVYNILKNRLSSGK